VELDKDLHKEYRHNIEIMQDENKKLKVSTKLMKSQVEEL
jgi:hypothetical protein